ncbi:Uncharacterised protein [Citrobacter koseri]|nr:Uncharacterised protein [Citrobacter koseri]
MKNIFTLTFLALSCLSTHAIASEKLAGNEILAVQKGGVPDKIYENNKPHLRIATYNIGKNEASENVADFTSLNAAIKKLQPISLRFQRLIIKPQEAKRLIN